MEKVMYERRKERSKELNREEFKNDNFNQLYENDHRE